jgi:hypothetical protein
MRKFINLLWFGFLGLQESQIRLYPSFIYLKRSVSSSFSLQSNIWRLTWWWNGRWLLPRWDLEWKNAKVIVSLIFCVVFLPLKRRFVEERLIFIKTYILWHKKSLWRWMITFITFLCDGISYENTLKSSSIKFVLLMFMNVNIGDTPKDPWGNFRIKNIL